ncbi:hypothetical protein [Sandarakinorhabdus sp.]|uniref:hypothetical protein n=1 Tax=Sandarakinorhabdus sp. TaxID=1916663 RepID=UPI00334058D3
MDTDKLQADDWRILAQLADGGVLTDWLDWAMIEAMLSASFWQWAHTVGRAAELKSPCETAV